MAWEGLKLEIEDLLQSPAPWRSMGQGCCAAEAQRGGPAGAGGRDRMEADLTPWQAGLVGPVLWGLRVLG